MFVKLAADGAFLSSIAVSRELSLFPDTAPEVITPPNKGSKASTPAVPAEKEELNSEEAIQKKREAFFKKMSKGGDKAR